MTSGTVQDESVVVDVEPSDRRTREWREWKARRDAAHSEKSEDSGSVRCRARFAIWPCMLEALRRLSRNDDRFRQAAKDSHTAARQFELAVEDQPERVVEAALAIWPTVFRDYRGRGFVDLLPASAESSRMALQAALEFCED